MGRLADLVKQLQQVGQCCCHETYLLPPSSCLYLSPCSVRPASPVMLRVAERMQDHLVLRQTPAARMHACFVPKGSLCRPVGSLHLQSCRLLPRTMPTWLWYPRWSTFCDQATCCFNPQGLLDLPGLAQQPSGATHCTLTLCEKPLQCAECCMQAIDETNTMTSEAISGVRQHQEAAGLAPVAGGSYMLAWPDTLTDQHEEQPMSVGGKAAAGMSLGSGAEGSAPSLASSRSVPACLSSAAIACTG